MKNHLLTSIALLFLFFGLIQFIPITQSNPAVIKNVDAPPHVHTILKRACYDCHSHETVWPWYSNIAPASWLLAWDVHEGREELNFSIWNQYTGKKKEKMLKEIAEEIEEGEMPPWFYLPLHPEAQLSSHDKQQLREWALQGMPQDDRTDDDD
ncbi:MAG: heme-binding domain-containing protein [Nitrospirales bacterium]